MEQFNFIANILIKGLYVICDTLWAIGTSITAVGALVYN